MAKSRKTIKNQCTAKSKRTQKRCRRSATPGKHVCYYHGGASPGGKPGNTQTIKHGLYSNVLTGDDKVTYENLRVQPATLDDHIALLETKIIRFARAQNGEWSFDDWRNEVQQEFERVMPAPEGAANDRNIPVAIKRKTIKPLGPGLLCDMLTVLTRMYWRRHQIFMDGQGDAETDTVKFVKSPFPMPDKKAKSHAKQDLENG